MITFEQFKGSMKYLFGMAGNTTQQVVMVDTNGIGFGSRFWMHEKLSLSIQGLGQQDCLKQTQDDNQSSKNYMNFFCKHYKTLHYLPCYSNTFTRKYLDLRESKHATKISTNFTVVLHQQVLTTRCKSLNMIYLRAQNNCKTSNYPRQ